MKQLVGSIFLIVVFLNLSLSAQTNVALNKQVTVSTVQTGNIATNAVDDNTSTRWCASSGTAPQWLMVDLGGSYSVSRTEVMWEKTAIYKYRIETSSDNSTWTQQVDRTANTTSQQTFIDYFTATARYVRITATALPSGTWASMFEFRVFGTIATTSPIITTQPVNLTVADGQNATFTIAATGNPTPSYQWRRNGINISGANSTSYTVNSAAITDSGAIFSCLVSNSAGSVTSSNAVLTVQRNLRRQDSLALMAIYNSTGGTDWAYHWTTSQPINTWFGVRVIANRVEKLSLESDNLVGVLPREIGNLTALDSLTIGGNVSLVNPIPNEIGNLKNLIYLRFYGNGFTDSIPSIIRTLPRLKYLGFSERLTCTIPAWICAMTTLEYLNLNDNAFTGTIPTEIGNLTALTGLCLSGYDYTVHGLSGAVPSSIGNLRRLTFLSIGYNYLTSIPDTVMTIPNLTSGYFTRNCFCNLSPALISWLNARDAFWYANQICLKPEIQINATPLSGAAPLNVAFTGSNIGSSSIETWAWNFGDGGTATSQNISHTYTNAGTFVARLIGTGIGGSDTVSVSIQVINPPVITTQPVSQSVNQGTTASFSVVASGTSPLSYQWYKNGSAISGAVSSTYTKSNVQAADTGSYTVTVSNTVGSVTSDVAHLTVILLPVITNQPVTQTVYKDAPVTFSVTASGTAPLSYQWRKNGTNISGATVSSYSIASAQFVDSGNYTVVVSNSAGNATSSIARLTVSPAPQPPVITNDPKSQIVSVGGSVLFSLTATGTQPFSYVWRKNGAVVGGNTSTFAISSVSFNDSGSYSVIVSNSLGSDTSSAARLTVVADSIRTTNQLVSIRGKLYDTTGTPVGVSTADTIDAIIRLYDSLVGGTVQYTEFFKKADQHQIIVEKGIFTINLGQGTTTDSLSRVIARNASLWVEITVDGSSPDVLLPRLPLTASPYSLSRVQGSANYWVK